LSAARALLVVLAAASVACGGGEQRDARYPPRAAGCKVKAYAASPTIPVDELGTVTVECSGSSNCGRKLMDAVCRVGGDVVWGLGENPVTSMSMTAHAAHSADKNWAPRAEGCDVKVYRDAPSSPAENIGPVDAVCGLDVSDADCLRQLEDETCKLGGDVVWGVGDPVVSGVKKRLSGRAAHTKSSAPAPAGSP
jgi:hypothetical protein